jgi:hypothetical protein
MNLPVNDPVVKNVFLEKLYIDKLFYDLNSKKFDGFIQLTIDGKYGFEEAFIIFEKGNIAGNIYLIEGYDVELYGQEAFSYSMNAFGSKLGIINIYNLKEDQIKLVLIFNDKIKYSQTIIAEKKAKPKNYFLNNIKYDEKKIENLLKTKIDTEATQKDLFDERGLDELFEKQ